ncbi:Uncharacterised protein [Yersinia pekkanenii]|uniref:Glycosyl hydrolase n=2 Tax=Yersinia pekkanenii TaxID=1288385 RepID=A0A0T9NLX1_9GAMM|nr:hypothetical protein [Yersinia pekkanenii]CNH19483.1 Uncharacterised protein [Yersinia pekkanenii]CRY66063.1 Uncharacterised protein [Yersinia pekkanenii]
MKLLHTLVCVIGLTSFSSSASLVNAEHLDALYQKVTVANKTELGLIHIYSEFPDYRWVKDPIEGVSAIDDVARAAIFYQRQYQSTGSAADLEKVKSLVEFILYQRADNGYFYNFIYPDHSINKEYKTSVAEPNWWTWRALWALTQAYPTLVKTDSALAERTRETIFATIDVIYKDFNFKQTQGEKEGVAVAEWLPHTAGDQASVLLMALSDAQALDAKPEIEKMMRSLAAGIMLMQVKDPSSPVNGAFLSWQNLWHGYGNSQAYSLLVAGNSLGDRDMIKAAFNELDHFHPWLINNGLLNEFTVRQQGEKVTLMEQKKFSQIAYIIRPMVFANIKAWQISRDAIYLERAVDLSLWFFKNNPAQAQMYYPVSGISFDGIDSATKVNKNSGAESTVEALLTLQLIESIPDAKRMLGSALEKLDIEQ